VNGASVGLDKGKVKEAQDQGRVVGDQNPPSGVQLAQAIKGVVVHGSIDR